MQLAPPWRCPDKMPNSDCSLEIVRTLGVGGMATVYLARRREGGRTCDVAIKKPHAFLAEDPESVAVLEDEARLGACIDHPNVVRVIGLTGGDEQALVMEWIDGMDLGKLLRIAAQAKRGLPVDVVAAIARDALAGLHAAHESRHADGRALHVVHRDVSPQNILVGFDGSARITDFGVAKAAFRQQHTVDGSIKGKLRYLAPEQLAGTCDRRADVYSVGAVLWELLTGEQMRKGNGVEMLVEVVNGRVQAPSESAPAAASLDAVVMRALERSPEERFATAAVMREAIERAVTVASKARVAEVVRALVAEATTATAVDEALEIREGRSREHCTNPLLEDKRPLEVDHLLGKGRYAEVGVVALHARQKERPVRIRDGPCRQHRHRGRLRANHHHACLEAAPTVSRRHRRREIERLQERRARRELQRPVGGERHPLAGRHANPALVRRVGSPDGVTVRRLNSTSVCSFHVRRQALRRTALRIDESSSMVRCFTCAGTA